MYKLLVAAAVIAVASCEAEAEPGYGYYGFPALYRPYYASGYAGPLPGASYQSVHRLHKREAEAEPGYGFYGVPAVYNAYPNWPGVSTPSLSPPALAAEERGVLMPSLATSPTHTDSPLSTDTDTPELLDTQEPPPPSWPGLPRV